MAVGSAVMTIHLVKGGMTMCGIATRDMRGCDRWVERDSHEAGAADCPECKAAMNDRKRRLRGLPPAGR